MAAELTLSQDERQAELEQLRSEMSAIRRQLDSEVDAVRDGARDLVDWKYYARRYPWMFFATTAAIGFTVVPRRIETVRPDPQTLAKLAKREQLVVTQDQHAADRQTGLGGTILGLLANAAMRAGLTIVGSSSVALAKGESSTG